ncbi:hypothetical protein ACH5RR_026087 [Cinchona calisaya]|uniref:Uncharacterized protein n=1 Tax=Cinchona calisaya TaxID=153742 RepID=A0ABD2Z4W5_9GENT
MAGQISFFHPFHAMGTVIPALPCKISHPTIRSPVLVQWIAPREGSFRLNVDGSSLRSKQVGGERVIWDSFGYLVLASANSYGLPTNMIAEARPFLHGIRHYKLGFS